LDLDRPLKLKYISYSLHAKGSFPVINDSQKNNEDSKYPIRAKSISQQSFTIKPVFFVQEQHLSPGIALLLEDKTIPMLN
jgi:hypothetical protein